MKLGILGILLLSICLLSIGVKQSGDKYNLDIPEDWPTPFYDFSKRPLTVNGVELGRHLFYDPILSRDSTISCSSCHLSYTAFTHVDHSLSHGIEDRIGTRNSPVLINLAWGKSFMWDGSVNHIEVQALAPIANPDEMDESLKNVVSKLNRSEFYKDFFKKVYGDSEITGERVLIALAQFQLTLISSNSRYDKMLRREIEYTEVEKRGYAIFQKMCSSCHTEPLLTNHEFANNGLAVDTSLNDYGRMKVSLNPGDSLKFKVPTLRNIEFSYPYMHDGRFKTLREVLDHYDNGIHQSKTLNPEMKKVKFSSKEEKIELQAFLLTLSDKAFLFNPKFAFPRKYFTPGEGFKKK